MSKYEGTIGTYDVTAAKPAILFADDGRTYEEFDTVELAAAQLNKYINHRDCCNSWNSLQRVYEFDLVAKNWVHRPK